MSADKRLQTTPINKIQPLSKLLTDHAKPFSVKWLDSAFHQTFLPGTPWHVINESLSDHLAERVDKQLANPTRGAVLAQLLGDEFMAQYFPDRQITDNLSHLREDEKKRLFIDANAWLRSQLIAVAKQIGCTTEEGSDLSPEMIEFLSHTQTVLYKALSRELYKQEQKDSNPDKELMTPSPIFEEREKVPRRNVLPDKRAWQTPSPNPPAEDRTSQTPNNVNNTRKRIVKSIKTAKVRDLCNDDLEIEEPEEICGKPSQLIGDAIVSILEKSPRRCAAVVKRLHGRLLPNKLRRFIWTETLYQPERAKLPNNSQEEIPQANIEKILREKFGRNVARNVGLMKIPRATKSPLNRLIENAVVETYEVTPALAACREEGFAREACRVLNILYTYDKTYEPYLVYWLFPLQVAYRQPAELGPEHTYELAMHLDLLNSSMFPTWTQIFAIADYTMNLLSKHDRQFHDHLELISKTDVDINCQQFVLELMKKEKKDADELLRKPDNKKKEFEISDSRIYMRKWIGEGFVSVLDSPCVMLVWDQLFMQGWHTAVLQDFTLVIMLLLRSRFMSANNHQQMREVFLGEPCLLLLVDIQEAWLILHDNETDYLKVSQCNRLNKIKPPQSVQKKTTPNKQNPTVNSLAAEQTPSGKLDNEMFGEDAAAVSPSIGLPASPPLTPSAGRNTPITSHVPQQPTKK